MACTPVVSHQQVNVRCNINPHSFVFHGIDKLLVLEAIVRNAKIVSIRANWFSVLSWYSARHPVSDIFD